jgi:phosphoribosylamine--glycine ligase
MSETVLLVGGGGREHAVARALADDCELYGCAGNRNPGIESLAAGVETLDATDPEAVREYAESVGADLAVVGPEAPLQAGVADALDDAGVYAFGPRKEEARIETDKAFQREFMEREGVPGCPAFETFEAADGAVEYVESIDFDVAVKPVGLTGGKGVKVTGDQVSHAEAADYVRASDHEEWVVEERLVGEEFTVQALVANGEFRLTPAVQDHKRAYEGDEGPNTGGMGSYSDSGPLLPFMAPQDYYDAGRIIESVVEGLPDYKGVLYGQFMLTAEGPKVVEFNARFGDPEAMNTLPVMETPFLDVLSAARDGERLPALEFARKATVCKYAVPAGYPTDPESGAEVTVSEETVGEDALLYYASVDAREDGVFTTTSRSFAVVGLGDTVPEAEARAEDALEGVEEGFRVRHDIGKPDLLERRVEHMDELRR